MVGTANDCINLLEALLRDESHSKPESKLRSYAAKADFSKLIESHPMLFIYCCASNGNVDQCIRLLATMSEYHNFETPKVSSEDIYELINFVKLQSETRSILKVIYEAETKYLEIIKAVPVLFFKATIDKGSFDIDQLSKLLNVRNRIEANDMSEHDAAVSVGSILVDKYVKPHLK
jgi:hypothetical protein